MADIKLLLVEDDENSTTMASADFSRQALLRFFRKKKTI